MALTPLPPLTPMGPLQPIWSTTIRRADATRATLGQEKGVRGEDALPAEQVPYDPEASDLVHAVLQFRAFHGYWSRKNVAVVEYTNADGVRMLAFATSSSNSTHSEEKLLLFLQALQDRGELGEVKRLYSERKCCNGIDPGHHCDSLVKDSPLMKGVEVSYSFDYTLAPDADGVLRKNSQEAEFKAQLAGMRDRANREGWSEQARQEQGDDVIHILPGTSAAFDGGLDDRPDTELDRRSDPSVAPPPGTVFQEAARAFRASDLNKIRPAPDTLDGDGTPQ